MMLFPGHSFANQGAMAADTTEFAEMLHFVGMLCADNRYTLGHLGTVAQKRNFINTVCDSVNIEFHLYTSVCDDAKGPIVAFKPFCTESMRIAEVLQRHLDPGGAPREGYYHFNKANGVDFFLTNLYPSVIVYVDAWNNLEEFDDTRYAKYLKVKTALEEIAHA